MTDYPDLLEWLDSKGKLSDYNCYKDASEAIRQLIAERDHYKEECLEQARLLGISGERELKLTAERDAALAELKVACETNSEKELRAEVAALKSALRETGKALEDLYLGFDRTREWGCLPMELVRAKAAIIAINEVLK